MFKINLLVGVLCFALVAADKDKRTDAEKEEDAKIAERVKAAKEKLAAKQSANKKEPAKRTSETGGIQLKADAPASIKALWDRRDRAVAARILPLVKNIKEGRRALTAASDADRKAKAARLKILEGQLDESLERILKIPSVMDLADLKVGMVGDVVLERVSQVIDEETALVYVDSHMPRELQKSRETKAIYLTGLDTRQMSDDTKVNKDLVLNVTGTHSYEAVSGAKRTVLKGKPFDIREYLDLEEASTKPPIPVANPKKTD